LSGGFILHYQPSPPKKRKILSMPLGAKGIEENEYVLILVI